MAGRFFLVLLAALWLGGCSSSSNSAGGGGIGPAPVPPPSNPLAITQQNSSAVAAAVLHTGDVDFLVPVDRAVPGRASVPTLSASSPNSNALALASSVALNGAGSTTSPLGGTRTVTADGRTLTAVFSGFHTLAATVDGTVQVVGSPDDFTADFDQVRVTTADGVQLIDGPARYQRSGNTHVVWTASTVLTVPQATVALDGFAVTCDFQADGGAFSGSKTYSGNLIVGGQGLAVSTVSPVTFSGPFTGGTAALQTGSGSVVIQGSQALSLQVGPAVALTLGDGTVVKRVPWGYLGGSADAADLLRPLVADTLYTNATFVTIDDQNPQAEALASLDGRILAVGPAAEVQQFVEPSTTVINLGGNTCLPGFVEPHIHVNLTALNFMSNVTPLVVNTGTYDGLTTLADSTAPLIGAAGNNPGAPVIFGYGFDPSRLAPPETLQGLTRQDLDAISSTIPIVVQNSSGHISYANTAALKASGIWPNAPLGPYTQPADVGGTVVLDPNTNLPNGQLNEAAQDPAIELLITTVVAQNAAAFAGQFLVVLESAASQGCTTACDMLTGAVLTLQPEEEILAQLARNHHPVVRMHSYLDTQTIDPNGSNVFAGEGSDEFRVVGAKFTADGSTQGLTAALFFDYLPGTTPFLPGPPNGSLDFPDTGSLLQLASAWHDLGFQISTHVNGDRAQDQVLDVYSQLSPRPDPRFRMEHFTVHTDAELASQVARVKALGVNVSMTNGHVFFWGQVFNDTILGPQVSKNIDPAATLAAAGVPFSFHSDAPISPMQPLRYVQTAVTRLWQSPPQQVLGPAEIITVPQALKAVTLDAARATRLEAKVGSLAVGKYTDLVILGANPLQVPTSQIADIPVLATFVGGQRVSGALP